MMLSACGDSSPTARESAADAAKPGKPTVEVPEGPPPEKLVVTDLREGSGAALDDPDDELIVQYVSVDYPTGKESYSTWERGPSKYLLEEVHRGWELGLKGMRVGGRRELIEPSRLAYGTGARIYVVDLLGVKDAELTPKPTSKKANSSSAKAIAKRPEPGVSIPGGSPPTELVVENLIEGIGPGANVGDKLAVRFVGYIFETGDQFENSWNLTLRFELGAGEVNEGWEEGLVGMKAGGRRRLTVPPNLAPSGRPETLIYVVDLLAIK